MTASTRRVRYIGRNHDTPSYQPVQMHETIAPMHGSEFEGPGAVPVGIAIWAAIFGAILS